MRPWLLESITRIAFGVCVHPKPVMLHPRAHNDWASRWDLDANQGRDVGSLLVISPGFLGPPSESPSDRPILGLWTWPRTHIAILLPHGIPYRSVSLDHLWISMVNPRKR